MTCEQCKHFYNFYKINMRVCIKHKVRFETIEYKTKKCTEFCRKDMTAGEQE